MLSREFKVLNELPPYYKIAEYLWGIDADYDSDGDSINPESGNWTELTLILRADEAQRIDVDPVSGKEQTLSLVASTEELLEKTITYLESLNVIKCV
ncbi:hypothetical protein [Neptuniibacter sp. QD57_21]|uniref:hypothetical protein n=1 Tax=Neptuniibacter sp. QD57_21 TaxID=3398213 RepID=UPI0039F60AC2